MTQLTKTELAEFAAEWFGAVIAEDYGNGTDHWTFPTAWVNKQVGRAWHFTSETINIDAWKSDLFDDGRIAPILMHLAKREMEKRGFHWDSGFRNETGEWRKGKYDFSIERQKTPTCEKCGMFEIDRVDKENDNEFIAFWSALEKAVGGGG